MKTDLPQRKFYGFSVKDAAALSGFPYVTVWRHLNNQRNISPEAAIRYHSTLGVPLADIWPPTSPNTPTEPEEEAVHKLA